jgi:hypothetical protein
MSRALVKNENDRATIRSITISQRTVDNIYMITGTRNLSKGIAILTEKAIEASNVLVSVHWDTENEESRPECTLLDSQAKLFGEWWEMGGEKYIEKGYPKYPDDMEKKLIEQGMIIHRINVEQRLYTAIYAKPRVVIDKDMAIVPKSILKLIIDAAAGVKHVYNQ